MFLCNSHYIYCMTKSMIAVILTSVSDPKRVNGHPTKKYEEGLSKYPEEQEQWPRSSEQHGVYQALPEQGPRCVVDMVPNEHNFQSSDCSSPLYILG